MDPRDNLCELSPCPVLSQLRRPSMNSHPVLSRLRRPPMSSRPVLSWLKPTVNSRLALADGAIFKLVADLSCPFLLICLIMNCLSVPFPQMSLMLNHLYVQLLIRNLLYAPLNSQHVYPVNPVTDNITTLNRINTTFSPDCHQTVAFVPLTPPVLSPETIYASHVFNINSATAI